MRSHCRLYFVFFFFFFQAEDGIRDLTVTGVQTCALPISSRLSASGNVPQLSRLRDRSALGETLAAADASRRASLQSRSRAAWRSLLDQRIPFTADVAASRPLRVLGPAVCAPVNASCLGGHC